MHRPRGRAGPRTCWPSALIAKIAEGALRSIDQRRRGREDVGGELSDVAGGARVVHVLRCIRSSSLRAQVFTAPGSPAPSCGPKDLMRCWPGQMVSLQNLADEKGFEPLVELPPRRFSKL